MSDPAKNASAESDGKGRSGSPGDRKGVFYGLLDGNRGIGSVHLVLTAVFLVPLVIGVYLSTGTNRRSLEADEVSRDLASMFSQGVDFSQPENQSIARRLLASYGKGVVVLTRIRMVAAADCASSAGSQCGNNGYPVIVQRIVIGDPNLHPSSLGAPASIDPRTGGVQNWINDASARVSDASVSLKPGEWAYAAETYIAGPDDGSGVYARAMF